MRQNRRFQRKGKLTEEQRRLLPVVIIPLIVIILMVIIVVADRRGDEGEPSGEALPTESVGETMGGEPTGTGVNEPTETEPSETQAPETEAPETEPADAFVTDTFQRDSVPEILDLMKRYFRARATADAEAMNQVYGIGEVSEADLEAQRARMRSNSKYVQDFEAVTTYVKQGTTSDAWLVYALADIRFHSVDTPAPMIMWCYVTKDAEGNYHIANQDTLSENVLYYIDAANHSEEVRRLASDVNVRLKEALNSDEALNEVYGVLREGSPVWQEGDDEPEVVIVDGESEAAPEGGAEGESPAVSADGESAAPAAETTAAVTETTAPAAETTAAAESSSGAASE